MRHPKKVGRVLWAGESQAAQARGVGHLFTLVLVLGQLTIVDCGKGAVGMSVLIVRSLAILVDGAKRKLVRVKQEFVSFDSKSVETVIFLQKRCCQE